MSSLYCQDYGMHPAQFLIVRKLYLFQDINQTIFLGPRPMMFLAYLQRGQYQSSRRPFKNLDVNLGGNVLIRNTTYEPAAVVELHPVPRLDPEAEPSRNNFNHSIFVKRNQTWYQLDNRNQTVELKLDEPKKATLVLYQKTILGPSLNISQHQYS